MKRNIYKVISIENTSIIKMYKEMSMIQKFFLCSSAFENILTSKGMRSPRISL